LHEERCPLPSVPRDKLDRIGADTVEKRRRVIDALNVTVSVKSVEGKPKAILHWWGIDAPLSLEEETPGGSGSALGPGSDNEVRSKPQTKIAQKLIVWVVDSSLCRTTISCQEQKEAGVVPASI
jgi:hypothetical protein